MNLGEKLKKKRISKRLSQERLARILDVTTRTVQRWEQGAEPSEMYIESIKKFLDRG